MTSTWESPKFLGRSCRSMHIDVKQFILMRSNIQTVIPWGKQGKMHPLLMEYPTDLPSGHLNRKNHTPHSNQMIYQRMNAASTGLADWTMLLLSPQQLLQTLLLFIGSTWILSAECNHPTFTQSGGSSQVQLKPVLCFLLSPHFPWHSWDLGLLGFPGNSGPLQKSWCEQQELRSSKGECAAPPPLKISCIKNAMWHSLALPGE